MAYAIIEAGGTQLWVQPGRFYDINLLPVQPDEDVTIDKVLFINNDGTVQVGQPYVDGATVKGTVMRHLRGRKIIVYKMRPKKKTRKKQGHRQELTRLMINAITVNGVTITEEDASEVDVLVPTSEAVAVSETVAEEAETVNVVSDAANDDSTGDDAAETTNTTDE